MKQLYLIVAAALAASCGSDQDKESEDLRSGKISGQEYVVRSDTSLSLTETAISGVGEIAFKAPVSTTSTDDAHVALQFSLEEGASIKLKVFANRDLDEGVEMEFVRSGASLAGSFIVGGSAKAFSGLQSMADFDATGAISLRVDVHNNETPAHVIFWDASPEAEVSHENEKLNSQDSEEGDARLPGNGRGVFWGLAVNGGTVTHAALSDAQEGH